MITWYAHARAYAEVKWPNLAPVSRRSVAEALVTVTVALTSKEPGAPEPMGLRQALSLWLNSGVPATEVARRAGHGVAVLLKIYAHCLFRPRPWTKPGAHGRIADGGGP